jgi:hypothetical protein
MQWPGDLDAQNALKKISAGRILDQLSDGRVEFLHRSKNTLPLLVSYICLQFLGTLSLAPCTVAW